MRVAERAIRKSGRGNREAPRGFTLIEVLLAMGMVIGIMTVIFFFYSQAANLRRGLTVEAEKISVARLLMERLTLELRTAQPLDDFTGLRGGLDFIEFAATQIPMLASWSADELEAILGADSDLKVVRYSAGPAGLMRSEDRFGISMQPVLAEEGDEILVPDEADAAGPTVLDHAILLTADLRFLRFRYWDGSDWQDQWEAPRLPMAVEIVLAEAFEGMDEETGEYPRDYFRRVVYLPGHVLDRSEGTMARLFEEDLP